MKQTKKSIVMTLVALFVSATSMWAAGTVTIIKQLNGVQNDAAGTVEYVISDQAEAANLCTLTVTPAEGNYISVEYITAVKTVSGNFAQSRRRAPGPDVAEPIAVERTSEVENITGETEYTFLMPSDEYEYDVEVTVNFQARTSIAGAIVSLEERPTAFVYDGDAKTPAVTSVTLGSDTSLEPANYTVSYENNINAGDATVKVTGLGIYTGEATTTFVIEKAVLAELVDLYVSIESWAADGEPSAPSVEGNLGQGAVTYTYSADGGKTYTSDIPNTVGNYLVKATIAETQNYLSAEAENEFSIYRELNMFVAGQEWATYYASEDLNCPNGLIVYIVTARESNTLTADEFPYIPANVPVLLQRPKQAEGPFMAEAYDGDGDVETPDSYTNLLRGVATDTDVTSLSTSNNNDDIYVLYNGEFVKSTSGTIPANRAYLPIAKEQGAPARLSIAFGNEETGISSVAAVKTDNVFFNLGGQRIAQPTKGLYIVNGKKVVLK